MNWSEMMSDLPAFRKWMLQYLVGMLLVLPLAFLVTPHLLFGIPVRSLGGFCLAVAAVMIVFAPLLYFSNRHGRKSGNWKPLFAVVGLVGEAMCVVLFYYAAKFSLLSAEVARGSAIALAVGLPLALVLDYYAGRRLFPKFFRARNGSSAP